VCKFVEHSRSWYLTYDLPRSGSTVGLVTACEAAIPASPEAIRSMSVDSTPNSGDCCDDALAE